MTEQQALETAVTLDRANESVFRARMTFENGMRDNALKWAADARQHLDRAIALLTPEPVTLSSGDSVTIERDRAAMDALRRLAEQNGWPTSGWLKIEDWLNAELSALRDFRAIGKSPQAITEELTELTGLRKSGWRSFHRGSECYVVADFGAPERLPGEGDVVEWKYTEQVGNCMARAIQGHTGQWFLIGPVASYWVRISDFHTSPHPDLHPVRVDGVWRWQRKEKV